MTTATTEESSRLRPTIVLAALLAFSANATAQNVLNDDFNDGSPFGNGTVRLQITPETSGTVTGFVLADGIPFDGSETYGQYYNFMGSTYSHEFFGWRCRGFTVSEQQCKWMGSFNAPFNPGTTWQMESSNVDGRISLKVWQDGQPEPARPQINFVDPNPFSPAGLGMGGWIADDNPTAAYIGVTFDDVSFLPVPEPAGHQLLVPAMLSLLGLRSRRRG